MRDRIVVDPADAAIKTGTKIMVGGLDDARAARAATYYSSVESASTALCGERACGKVDWSRVCSISCERAVGDGQSGRANGRV